MTIMNDDDRILENEVSEEQGVSEKSGVRKILTMLTIGLFPLSVLLNIYLLGGFGNRMDNRNKKTGTEMAEWRELKNENAELKRNIALMQPPSAPPEGVFLEVQLGAFQNFNLDEYLSEMAAIRQEKHDGKNKLLLGRFTDLNKALRFENDLKRIGVEGAFIVGRINGTLVSKEEAIKAMKEMK